MPRFCRTLRACMFAMFALLSVRASADDQALRDKSSPRSPAARLQSQITGVFVAGSQSVGTFGGVAYQRTWGMVRGIVAPGENVHGLDALPHDANGNFIYQSQYELIAPERPGSNSTILVEAENRGSPVLWNSLHGASVSGHASETNFPGPGNGFLFTHGTSYARVSWQAGISPGVPREAQGVGEVILRDFARLLAGKTQMESKPLPSLGNYRTLILGGISLGGFYINTFLAEGFNADPVDGRAVFDGAIAVDGTGNWIAINQMADEAGIEEFPYVVPNAKPLDVSAILRRPASDPFYVDIANYTDFYRLRASVTDKISESSRIRRYDWPSPHAAAPLDSKAIRARAARCNGGAVVDLNPISYAPYLRAVTLELEHELGVESAKSAPHLSPSILFQLGPAPESTANFNPLPGNKLAVPATDADAQPLGGVRFPEVVHPIGRPFPVSLAPVVTTSIDATCGNLGEWQQFPPADLARRYGDESGYLKLYAQSLDKLISEGYLLPEDREEMLREAKLLYEKGEK